MKLDDFEIVKSGRFYTVRNWKLNTVIESFTTYIDAYKCVMALTYTERNK